MLTHGPWTAVPGLRHGFLEARECTGSGGWDAVVARAGSPVPLVVPRQVHGVRVVAAPAWHEGAARSHVDLRLAVSLLLRAAGVTDVAILGPCTVCGPGYHSFRRDGAGTGRQLSFVGWAPR